MNKEQVVKHAMTLGYGGMNEAELAFLYDYCKDKNVLELGSHIGQSSYVIASVAKHLTCVDAWIDGTPFLDERQASEYRKQEPGMIDQFNHNTKSFNNITVIQGFTQDVTINGVFDIVLIDADHSYEGVQRDIKLYRNKGKIIIFHDYNSIVWTGVKQAVDESNLQPLDRVEYLLITKGEGQ